MLLSSSSACVETAGLTHRYGDANLVLDRVNLQVPLGSIYGFLGPNGAGKTTTLRLLLGLLRTQEGTITVFGKPFTSHRVEILRAIGSLIESPSLYEQLSAAENLAVWQKVYRCPKARIAEVLDLVGLAETGSKRAGRFSLGMKQRLGIAVALLPNPALLILDEPTNGLDPHGMMEIRKLLTRLNQEDGVTILVSSHLLAEIEKFASHLGIIHEGRVKFEGTIEELRRQRQQTQSICSRTSDDEKALSVVAQEFAAARRDEERIVVPPLSNEEVARVTKRLVEAGIGVHEISSRRHDLESIFMNLVAEPKL